MSVVATAAHAQSCGTLTTCPVVSLPLSGSELLYIVQGGVSKKITAGQFLNNGLTFPLSIALGGTGQTTAVAALGVNGLDAFAQLAGGTGNFTIPVTARTVLVGGITAPVTYTLPLASQYPIGFPLILADYLGNVTTTNTVTLAAQGSNTVNGEPTLVALTSTFGSNILESDGVSHWFTVGSGGSGGGGGGGGNGFVDDYAAGSGFTPGVSTQFTLTVTPVNASAVQVAFDGVKQFQPTWSLSGNVVTLASPVPSTTNNVEIQGVTSGASPSSTQILYPEYSMLGGL